jgi:hypothetical protein
MNIKDEAGEYLRITKELVNGSHGIWLEEFIKRGLQISQ